ncbi:uncharacterized protein LOC106161030 isoform X1 [Lingula anatina]|uniref:RBR-type E3 ubiquitin transferase n=1 Tax=Lingula anatina TaxID=7574 RepID=A0A1S3I639_LINAN|nr:uncharacterized protein LOC106161030 isoform X1 [Lingula anatina]|eukprot:XP_013393311.1 uncharacterized protein LOC106161030 isoform X1 [Lingula anatina]
MVWKGWKRNVHSGNTLRASNSHYQRCYAAEASLLKHSSAKGVGDDIEDGGLQSGGVTYSLNKKGRWKLPKLLKQSIHEGEWKNEDCKVSLFEHHKIKQHADCISYCSSGRNGSCIEIKPQGHAYFNAASVLVKSGNGKRSQKKREKRLAKMRKKYGVDYDEESTGEEVVDTVQHAVSYEIYYPCPKTSSITHNKKYIRDQDVSSYEDAEHNNNGSSKISKKGATKQRGKLRWSSQVTEYEEQFDNFYSSEDEVELEDTTREDEHHFTLDWDSVERSNTVLSDLVDRAVEAKGSYNSGLFQGEAQEISTPSLPVSQDTSKDNKVFFPADEYYEFRPKEEIIEKDINKEKKGEKPSAKLTKQSSKRHPCVSIPVIIDTTNDAIAPEVLQSTYGDYYKEGNCIPRTFTIDISKFVLEQVRKDTILRSQVSRLDLHSYLVVQVLPEGGAGTQATVKVSLKGNFKMETVRIETLNDMGVYASVDALVSATAVYICMLPFECFYTTSAPPMTVSKASLVFDTLSSACKWETASGLPAELYSTLIGDSEANTEMDETCEEDTCVVYRQSEEYCNICFEWTSQGYAMGVAISPCYHWFCRNCWQQHIESRVQQGDMILYCPEYQCSSRLDIATLVSLVDVRTVRHHLMQKHEMALSMEENLKWCPNRKCGRMIMAKGHAAEESVSVSCKCGAAVCFKCMKAPHWPARCDLANNYKRKLRVRKDNSASGPEDAVVFVRRCPHCRLPIEKNGGCSRMICRCGKDFCWQCLAKKCICSQGNTAATNEAITLRYIASPVQFVSNLSKEMLYRSSVEHRRAAREYHGSGIDKKIKTMLYRGKHGELDFPIIAKQVQKRVEKLEQMQKFLESAADFNAELHHLAEHTALHLQDDQVAAGVEPIFKRIDFVSWSINEIFNDERFSNMDTIMKKLSKLMSIGKTCVQSLASVLRQSGKQM